MMREIFFYNEPGNRVIYDDVRKYCLLERLSREEFHSLNKNPNSTN